MNNYESRFNEEKHRELKKFEESSRKKIILTRNDLVYETSSLKVFRDFVSFYDKFGNFVQLSFSQIQSISEVAE